MADIALKYLTDLPSASDAESADLMHINQSGSDRSITLDVLAAALFNIRYPVGKVEWFANDTNPNALWAGSTWARVPGSGRAVRLANESGSDALATSGSDVVTIEVANLPEHKFSVKGSTNSTDLGTKSTSSNGAHTHGLPTLSGTRIAHDDSTEDDTTVSRTTKNTATTSNGSHSHNITLGSHTHDIDLTTNTIGNGKSLNIKNASINLAAWYRIS